jgi:hypothetical protein
MLEVTGGMRSRLAKTKYSARSSRVLIPPITKNLLKWICFAVSVRIRDNNFMVYA